MAVLQVQKKEGGIEDWNLDKVITSMTKAGLSLDEAKHVASLVESWALRSNQNGIVISSQIKDKVIQFLRVIDPVATAGFESYTK